MPKPGLIALLAAATLAATGPAAAQTPPTPSPPPALPAVTPPYGAPITLAAAQALVTTALAQATTRRLRCAIAIVEPSGELVAFVRMDDTQYGSLDVAIKKARTAARYRQPTSVTEARLLAGRTTLLANPDVMPIAGAVPILAAGRIIGAIGVSGATPEQDDEIARAALAATR